MRVLFIGALLAALVVLAIPSARADASFSDAVGDVVAQPAGAAVPDNEQVKSTDIVGLDVVEGEYDWTFTLKLASLGQQGGTINAYSTDFVWQDATYRVSILRSRFDPTSAPLLRAQLQLRDGSNYNKVIDLDVVEEANALTVTFGKLYVASLEGHAPTPGAELTGVLVQSRGDPNFGNVVPVTLTDELLGKEAIVYTKGGAANGHIVLEPADPVRISNGGSGTFVYTVHVQNRGETDDVVDLTLADVPAGWEARVHPNYAIPAGEEAPVVIIATLPFEHAHGGFSALTLNAASRNDPAASASVKLGVVHTPIPQPAGHHDELFLHAVDADSGAFQTAFPRTLVTMNTLSDHAGDKPEANAGGDFQGSGGGQGPATWRIPLGPQLAMGLDFDLARTGTLAGKLLGRTTGTGELAAELWLTKGDADVLQLASAPPASLTLDVQNPVDFAFVLTPTAESDYVPYAPGQNLELRLALTTEAPCCPPTNGPTLVVEGFAMKLPLNEYHEAPVINEEGGEIIATIEVTPEGPIEKRARPGSTMTFPFLVKNGGDAPVEIVIELDGTGKEHLVVLPALRFPLEAGGLVRVLAGMRVPTDSNEGEILEGVLVVRSATDPANLAIGRTSTVVTNGDDAMPDEAAILAGEQPQRDTPAVGIGAVIALCLALALLRMKDDG